MTINASTGVVSWASPTSTGSPHTVTIRAANSAGSDDESWQLTVTGEAVVVESVHTDPASPKPGGRYQIVGVVKNTGGLAFGPFRADFFEGPRRRDFKNYPGLGAGQSLAMKSDSLSVPATGTWTYKIALSNGSEKSGTFVVSGPPSIASISDAAASEGSAYTGPTPSSGGAQGVVWTLVAGPSGMSINASTGVVSWASPTITGSPHTVTIRATSGAGSDDESWQLTVSPTGPPAISPLGDQTIPQGAAYTGPVPASGGTRPLTWSLVAGPSGMTINASTGVVSWASPTSTGSPHTVTIRATNGAG
jgi:hypothetical protein